MKRFLLKRLALMAPVLLGAATLVFLLLHLIPTGAVLDRLLGETAPEDQRDALRRELHLDLPVLQQYGIYLRGLVHGDLGRSLEHGRPVTRLILERMPATLALAGAAALVAVLVALPAGMIAAWARGGWIDRLAMGFSILGVSIPNFWLGPLLILLFAVQLDWLPVAGMSGPASVILPAVTLGTSMAAYLARMIRGSLLEEMASDYVRSARSKGMGEAAVFFRHLLPNTLIPVITVLALQLGMLLTGAIITESIFAWPGMGLLLLGAIDFRDFPLVQGCVLVIALSYMGMNLAADAAYAWLDPRIRFS
ncbi:MAG: ABC transporter permease [Acidobacteriota bacterium]|jgi:peptide/nickel transport system permease protein